MLSLVVIAVLFFVAQNRKTVNSGEVKNTDCEMTLHAYQFRISLI